MRYIKHALLAVFAAGLWGCSSEVAVSPGPVSLSGTNKARAMTVAEEVLTDIGFTIEKADVEEGFLSTRPLRGGQFFEIWRQDNASLGGVAEASTQSIQRIAQLEVTEEGGAVMVACNVDVRRLSLPENDYVTKSRSAGIFTDSSRSRQRLEIAQEQAKYTEWIDLGRDVALESRILQMIQGRLGGAGG